MAYTGMAYMVMAISTCGMKKVMLQSGTRSVRASHRMLDEPCFKILAAHDNMAGHMSKHMLQYVLTRPKGKLK